jgi:hypothetical protein
MKKLVVGIFLLLGMYSLEAQTRSRDVGFFMEGSYYKISEWDWDLGDMNEKPIYTFYYQNEKHPNIRDIESTKIGDVDDLKKFIYDCDSLLNTIELGVGENIYDVEVGIVKCSVSNMWNQTMLFITSDDELGYGIMSRAVIESFKKSLIINGIEVVGYNK